MAANRFYGIERGMQATTLSVGGSTTGKKIELSIDTSVGMTRAEVINAIENISIYVLNERVTSFAQ